VRQYSKESVTSIIHGKAKHEETKATTSQATAYGTGHYLVVYNLTETDYVCNYILKAGAGRNFGRSSKVRTPTVSTLMSTCKPSAWPTRPRCFGVKPRKSSAASAPP